MKCLHLKEADLKWEDCVGILGTGGGRKWEKRIGSFVVIFVVVVVVDSIGVVVCFAIYFVLFFSL